MYVYREVIFAMLTLKMTTNKISYTMQYVAYNILLSVMTFVNAEWYGSLTQLVVATELIYSSFLYC